MFGCGIGVTEHFTNKSIIRGLLIYSSNNSASVSAGQSAENKFLENALSLMAASSGIVLLFISEEHISFIKLGHFAFGIYLFLYLEPQDQESC